MPMPINPIKPNRATVWMTLLLFFVFGFWLITNGMQFNSLGSQILGALLVAAGICFSIQWFMVRKK